MNIIIHRGKGGFQESAGQPLLMQTHTHMQTHTGVHFFMCAIYKLSSSNSIWADKVTGIIFVLWPSAVRMRQLISSVKVMLG